MNIDVTLIQIPVASVFLVEIEFDCCICFYGEIHSLEWFIQLHRSTLIAIESCSLANKLVWNMDNNQNYTHELLKCIWFSFPFFYLMSNLLSEILRKKSIWNSVEMLISMHLNLNSQITTSKMLVWILREDQISCWFWYFFWFEWKSSSPHYWKRSLAFTISIRTHNFSIVLQSEWFRLNISMFMNPNHTYTRYTHLMLNFIL